MERDGARNAPIFTAAWDLAAWLLPLAGRCGRGVLADELARAALVLLDHVTLALKNVDRDLALQDADLCLVRLRLRLRLAAETGLIEDRQCRHGLELADAIGRQLGGWQRRRQAPE